MFEIVARMVMTSASMHEDILVFSTLRVEVVYYLILQTVCDYTKTTITPNKAGRRYVVR